MGDDPNAVPRMKKELKKQAEMTKEDWLELAVKEPNSFSLRKIALALIEEVGELREEVNYLNFLNGAE